MTFSRHNSGETLVEVLIALSIIMVVAAPASAGLVSASRTTAMHKTYLIGSLLAEDGVEMMRNIRDTNLLRFSANQANCWNTMPRAECGPNGPNDRLEIISRGRYRIGINPQTFQWSLERQTRSLSDNLAAESQTTDANYRLYLDGASNLYVHQPAGQPASSAYAPTDFYREIEIGEADLDSNVTGFEALTVTSRVRYSAGIQGRTITRTILLTKP